MIKFVIVDDEKQYVNLVNDIIQKIMFNNEKEYRILNFDSYNNELEDEINDTSTKKVYILDIEIKGKRSGIDIAKMIRDIDWNSEIIFITSHDKMFETVYRNLFKVFDFIEKFNDLEDRLYDDLYKIINQNYDNCLFSYANSRIDIKLYLKDILYIYRDTVERKLVIVTKRNSFKLNMSINEMKKRLDGRFRQVHRACIVNDDMVQEYNWTEGYFLLKTGDQINLCSKNFKDDENAKY
jgi:DNA-binding LytR/AlgR family response regulator